MNFKDHSHSLSELSYVNSQHAIIERLITDY